jgi:parvulin-like peptidyl-prolyl isomerase
VDGQGISLAELEDRVEKELSHMNDVSLLPENKVEALRKDVLNELIDERVMLNRADKLGIAVGDGELKKRIEEIKKDYSEEGFAEIFRGRDAYYRNWKEGLRKRLILEKLIEQDVNTRVTVTDEEVLSYHSRQKKRDVSKERVHVSQIVLQNRETAETVLQRLKDGEDFARLAGEFSTGPEAEKGGDLGFFSRGVLPETFDRTVFSLAPGKISNVVETPYGYHIFKVMEKEKRGERGWAETREKIKAKLRREKEEREYSRWLEALRSKAVVKINEVLLRKAGEKKERTG